MPEVPKPRSRKPRTTTGTTGTTESTEPAPTPPTKERTPQDRKLAEAVAGMYSGVGMLVMGIGVPLVANKGDDRLVNTGVQLQNQAEQFAEAWMNLADRNPKVKAALRKATEGGAFAEVAALHIALILPYLPGIPALAAMQGVSSSANGTAENVGASV